MKLREYIKKLEVVADKHENDIVGVDEINIAAMCNDLAGKIESIDELMFSAISGKAIKKIIDEQLADKVASEMTEEQRKAFDYGVNMVIDFIHQMAENDLKDNHIMVYHPAIVECEEMDLDEIVDLLEDKPW